jgi:hypothetical protein
LISKEDDMKRLTAITVLCATLAAPAAYAEPGGGSSAPAPGIRASAAHTRFDTRAPLGPPLVLRDTRPDVMSKRARAGLAGALLGFLAGGLAGTAITPHAPDGGAAVATAMLGGIGGALIGVQLGSR